MGTTVFVMRHCSLVDLSDLSENLNGDYDPGDVLLASKGGRKVKTLVKENGY